MNTLLRITLILVSSFAIIYSPFESKAQCKVDTSDPIKGEFSINGTKVQVNGDGGGVVTAANNIPIRICEGELITLKNTLQISSPVSTSYWVMKLETYMAQSIPIQSLVASIDRSYSLINGSVDFKLNNKSTDPRGLSSYQGPGKYVITQYDNSTTSFGVGFHHACQVIEVITPIIPEVTVTSCALSEFQIEFPKSLKNIFDDYEITFYSLLGTLNPILKTGKPSIYPFFVKSGFLPPGNEDRIITVRGLSVTGGCNAPINNLGVVKLINKIIYKPKFDSILGTTQQGEFKLSISSRDNFQNNVYTRETQSTNTYDYTKVFKTYNSSSKIGFDTVTVTVPNANKQYCFQLEAIDLLCKSGVSRNNEELCTTPSIVIAQSNKNVVTWAKANNFGPSGIKTAPFNFYQVIRLNSNGTTDKMFPIRPYIDTLQEEDVNTVCGQEYHYQVLTDYGIKSYSQLLKVTAKSNDIPTKIPRMIAGIDYINKNAIIQGGFNSGNIPNNIMPNAFKFYRSNSINGTFSLQNTSTSLFRDLTTDINKQSYCYYMTCTNLCGNESEPSEKVCTVFQKNKNGILEWTKENSHSVPTDSYIVQEVDSKGFNIQALGIFAPNSNSFNLQNLILDYGEEKFFQIEARPQGWNVINNNNSLPSTLSNVIRIFRAPLLANEQEETLLVKIYPNPSQEVLSIELINEKPEIVNWILQNQTGQLINQSISDKLMLNYQAQIDIKSLSKGMYFLKIQSGEKALIRKIIKD